ncbi:hypothetical protein J8273_3565 [Carpediemonas membranifera]|uniref:OTU domain-containing protein n=1 Tax=Carpediemonas membranifera TaxID=201153 RepID=A0A8J6DZC3_9EUKA|nr:hypothetical protein J8273_3565 [Carpediemonas membranifera]|eukprot:KAG9393429.1 hypothetical protein J8273_3565 [Carpediemonas membranifera]
MGKSSSGYRGPILAKDTGPQPQSTTAAQSSIADQRFLTRKHLKYVSSAPPVLKRQLLAGIAFIGDPVIIHPFKTELATHSSTGNFVSVAIPNLKRDNARYKRAKDACNDLLQDAEHLAAAFGLSIREGILKLFPLIAYDLVHTVGTLKAALIHCRFTGLPPASSMDWSKFADFISARCPTVEPLGPRIAHSGRPGPIVSPDGLNLTPFMGLEVIHLLYGASPVLGGHAMTELYAEWGGATAADLQSSLSNTLSDSLISPIRRKAYPVDDSTISISSCSNSDVELASPIPVSVEEVARQIRKEISSCEENSIYPSSPIVAEEPNARWGPLMSIPVHADGNCGLHSLAVSLGMTGLTRREAVSKLASAIQNGTVDLNSSWRSTVRTLTTHTTASDIGSAFLSTTDLRNIASLFGKNVLIAHRYDANTVSVTIPALSEFSTLPLNIDALKTMLKTDYILIRLSALHFTPLFPSVRSAEARRLQYAEYRPRRAPSSVARNNIAAEGLDSAPL